MHVLKHLGVNVEIGDDGKQSVIEAFRNRFKNTELIDGFNFLLTNDDGYSSFLKETMRGGIRRESYDKFVNLLGEECNLTAISWEYKISRMYGIILDGKLDPQEGSVMSFPQRGKER